MGLNFAVAVSQETLEKSNRVMGLYERASDKKKEETLLRLMEAAESEAVRGTHPELEEPLRAVDTTISTLIKQINGVVSGQDLSVAELQRKLDTALSDKMEALAKAEALCEEAEKKIADAKLAEEKSAADKAAAEAEFRSETEKIRADARNIVERAEMEASRAVQERDDARAIADEKSRSNDLLLSKMQVIQEDLEAYKALQNQFHLLQEKHRTVEADLRDQIRNLREQLSITKRDNDAAQAQAKVQAELDRERAVAAKEREMQEKLRESDKEAARLQAKCDLLQKQLGVRQKQSG